jgi:hypothetical protein
MDYARTMLTLTARRQLQRLRFLLDEALDRSQDPTEFGRHSALILLDGACEYAMHIALGHLGQFPPDRFPKKFEALRQELGWRAGTWASIGDLHSARNGAQHHGIAPDASNMSGWAAEAQRFVEELVAAAFGVELRSVLLAESVEREDVRLQLIEAERSLEQEDSAGALAATLGAFDTAREAWRAQRVETVGPLRLQYSGLSSLVGGAETDPTNLSLGRFEDLSEVQPFAPDIGEYHWLLARRAEFDEQKPELAPSYATAQRAFLFIIAWVLRWEAFAARYERRRYAPPESPYEPPVTGADRPTIYDISVETQHHTGSWLDPPTLENVRYLVRITLSDLPTVDRALWAKEVGDVLDEAVTVRGFDHVGAARLGIDGIIRFHGVSADVTSHELLRWIDSALTEGERRYRQKLSEHKERDAALPSKQQNLEAAIRASDKSGLVDGVVSQVRDDGSVWVGARLRRDQDDPMLGHMLDGVVHTVRPDKAEIEYSDTTLWFAMDLDPAEADDVVQDVAARYEAEATKRQRGLDDVENRRRAIEAELSTRQNLFCD